MLEHYYARGADLVRFRSIPGSEYLDALAEHLHSEGYDRKTAQSYLRWSAGFLKCVAECGIGHRAIRESHLAAFLDDAPRTNATGKNPSGIWTCIRASLNHLKRILEAELGSLVPEPPSTPARESLLAYEIYLRDVCGFRAGTIDERIVFMREFLKETFGDGPLEFQGMDPAGIPLHVERQAREHKLRSATHLATAYRSYFRFLQFHGVPVSHLVNAVPAVKVARGAISGHSILSDTQVESLLAAYDHDTPKGQRDYGMLLCMLDLGMRSSDVSALSLDDLDWRESTILIPNVKQRHPYRLPLPKRVGKAISDYLHKGRPNSEFRNVFLRHKTPVRPMQPRSVQSATQHAYLRTGLPESWHGCHILRRTAATRMHRKGVPMKEIADILGHRSIDITAKYAHVDAASLTDLPLPWPKGDE